MIIFLIAAIWFGCGWLANWLLDRFFINAFTSTSDGASFLIHTMNYALGPIGLASAALWLAGDSYGFDGKKSPWRQP